MGRSGLGLGLALAVGLVISACGEAQTTNCSDATVCPNGLTCAPNGGCASPAQINACADLADGATCSAGTSGTCVGTICVLAACGNGARDEGEICDDGNVTSGDGCRADCAKTESCGDLIVDAGEDCDDGNTNPADGCDSCAATIWSTAVQVASDTSATATLGALSNIAVNSEGTVFISEPLGHRVLAFRLGITSVLVVAGTGEAGFLGDGGLATGARFSAPKGLAVDGLGNLYIADSGNLRVRKRDAQTGIVTTVAGDGSFGTTGDGGPAIGAGFESPDGIVLDGLGNLYIADRFADVVRRVDAATGTIERFAGGGAENSDGGLALDQALQSPRGLALDDAGNLYISEGGVGTTDRVRRVDKGTGVITTVAGGGTSHDDGIPATQALLKEPLGVAFDAQGRLVIADEERLRRIETDGTVSTLAPAIKRPSDVAMTEDGHLVVTDEDAVRQIAAGGQAAASLVEGGATGDGSIATSFPISPSGVAVAATGAVFIADSVTHTVYTLDPASALLTRVAGGGDQTGNNIPALTAALPPIHELALDSTGRLYLLQTDVHQVRQVDLATGNLSLVAGSGVAGFSGDGGAATDAELSRPSGIAVDSAGNLYIADSDNQRVRRVMAQTGVIQTVAGVGTEGFSGDDGPATAAELGNPLTLTFDSAQNLYIAEGTNRRIRRVDNSGVITTFAGDGGWGTAGDGGAAVDASISAPAGLVSAGNSLFFSSSFVDPPLEWNFRIRRVDFATGIVSSVAGLGPGDPEGAGDGGPVLSAQFWYPSSLAADPIGRLYVLDSGRLRRVDFGSDFITTVAGSVDPPGMGVVATSRAASPIAVARMSGGWLFAGGGSRTVQRVSDGVLSTVVGRYPGASDHYGLARYLDDFGDVYGIASDPVTADVYLTETSGNRLYVVTTDDSAAGISVNDPSTWTIEILANAAGTAGFADGHATSAMFREPQGLFFDAESRHLYIADTGNHVVRLLDLDTLEVTTVAGTPEVLGFGGDGADAVGALLFRPAAVARCGNGDLFIADTGSHRIRKVSRTAGTISTVLGLGVPGSSGSGSPARGFPVDSPSGVACDSFGNVVASSRTAVRLIAADDSGNVDGEGRVYSIYGEAPRDEFPESVTECVSGLAVADDAVLLTDACTGHVVLLTRQIQE